MREAVLLSAAAYGRMMPMLMTAAGTIKAARVVVMGVGVAGLQAIATAKRLGAVVEAGVAQRHAISGSPVHKRGVALQSVSRNASR